MIVAHHDTGVGLRSVRRNGGQEVGGRGGSARTSNLNLRALGVELRSVGLVESEKLVADQVVARLKALGDRAGELQVLVDIVGSPVVAV